MAKLAGGLNAIYQMTITPRVCQCKLPPKVFLTGRIFERVVARATPYWDAYIGFYGDQLVWLSFEIIDTRDGRILWRNGHILKGVDSGTIDGTE